MKIIDIIIGIGGIIIGIVALVSIHELKRRFYLKVYGIDIDELGIK